MKYIKLIELKQNKLIWNKKLIPINLISNIEYTTISNGFNCLYSGEGQNYKYYFGTYKNNKYILGDIIKPYKNVFKLRNKTIKKKEKQYNNLYIKMNGRLNGVNKARKYRIGNVKVQSIAIPIDYKSNPIQTKWGKIGLKVYIGSKHEY